MPLYITSLNSGSNGNCYYIGNDKVAILVDAGISCRETENRMKRLGLSLQKVKGIFISHEHADHIKGVPVLAKKYQIPIYITPTTLFHSRCVIDKHLVVPFVANQPVALGNLVTTAFSKIHDASDPYSFIVASDGVKVGIFTDIGVPCRNVIKHFKECHAAFLEANYDEVMLHSGNYPYHLKSRIRGGKGHLSNNQSLELFRTHKPAFMSHLVLSHLSENNNCPKIVYELFNKHAAGVEMIVAPRCKETALYEINGRRNINVTFKKKGGNFATFIFIHIV